MVNKRLILNLLLILVMTPFVLAAPTIEVQEVDTGSTIISELENPATFDVIIKNKGSEDIYEIFSLVGVSITPKGFFNLSAGITTIPIEAYFPDYLRSRAGYLSFEYQIRRLNSPPDEIYKNVLVVKIIELKDSLEINTTPVNFKDSTANVIIRNTQNTKIDNIKVKLKSPFFEEIKEVSLKPYEEKVFKVNINKDKIIPLIASTYPVTAEIETKKGVVSLNSNIKYLAKEGVSSETSVKGYLVKQTTITKKNEGNLPAKVKIEIKKDIISRLFTTNSIEPASIKRSGLIVIYTWEKEIGPTESFSITSTSNYVIPFAIVILLVLIVIFAKIYSQTALILQKRVSFVKTKGNEFALKVTLHVKARKNVDNIQIVDKLPHLAILYDKFGKMPHKIDKETRRLTWNIDKLTAGEERVYSYIIYSKVKVVGRFELPAAIAVFERENRINEVWSNRAFFVSETGTAKEENKF